MTDADIALDYSDSEGNPVCGECDRTIYDEEHFECCRCHEDDHVDEEGAIGNLIVIVDEDEAGLPVGYYQVISHPYYASAVLSSFLFPSSLALVAAIDGDDDIDTEGYAVGHLCSECSQKIKARSQPPRPVDTESET